MTSATSKHSEERQLDVTVGTIKRLLIMAYDGYNAAEKGDAKRAAAYWDGYIRALQHVLEQEHE
jgi:hypothetical protein